MSSYLVTGATGFLGGHLVQKLLDAGSTVVALCRKNEPELARKGVRIALGDILDRASVKAAAEGVDGVFHCAGKVSRNPDDAEELYRLHVDGTKTVLDAVREAGVKRVVIASTSGVVAVSKEPDDVRDENDAAPMELIAGWPYYRSKLFAERAAMERNGPDFQVISLNPSLLLGPDDARLSSTKDVVDFLEGKSPVTPAGGLSFVDARDAADVLIAAMAKGKGGERYLVGAANITIEAFFERLERISGVRAPRMKMPRGMALASIGTGLLERAAKKLGAKLPVDRISAEMGQCFWYLDASKATRELGFSPRDPNETLADTVNDLRARGVVWPALPRA